VLARAGYTHSAEVVMVRTGPEPDGPPSADAVALGELRPALTRWLRGTMPRDTPGEVVRQLVERRAARLRGADEVLFLAARDGSGAVASWADLYLDRAAGTAQIEELVTASAHTRRGYGDAVLAEALRRAAAADCALRFLVADAGDWPRHWYARRGFTAVGRSHVFTRP
jgi:GNAT superfamily N-acetyltransferase